jgi:hypothetical protein
MEEDDDNDELSPELQARLDRSNAKVQRHFLRLGFCQAGKAPDLTDAWFLTSKMYFGQNQLPQSALSRWLTKEEASQIEIHREPKKQKPTGLDRELAKFIQRLLSGGCGGFNVAQAMIGMPQQSLNPAVGAERYQKIMQMQELVRRGASIDRSHALHCAAALDFPDGDNFALKTLVSMGATVDACDEYGNTPLHVAAATMRAPSIRYLLSVGADPSLTNSSDETPLASLKSTGQSQNDFAKAFGISKRADPGFDECMRILASATRNADTKRPPAKKSRTS